MDYTALETNLIDQIKEQQAKLGYMKESVSLYYPLGTLNHFFGSREDAEGMQSMLNDFAETVKERYGEIKISRRKDRFCLHLPDTMSEYIHNTTGETEFIRELVKVVSDHDTTMDEIRKLFFSYSTHVEEKTIRDDEFDTMLRFTEDPEDRYYYCFKDEGFHITYHRFLPEDYRELFEA